MRLLVAIHDVAPPNVVAVQRLWELLRARNVTPALFVVPNWHGGSPLREFPGFSGWLRECAAEGADIFLHGERHDEHGLPRRPLDHLRALGRTNREGEFLTLTVEQARPRILRGRTVLHDCGLDPVGFVAPAWLARPELSLELARLGFRFSEDEGFIHLHSRGTRLRASVTRWSARSPLRAELSARMAEIRLRVHRGDRLARVALHPSDLSSPVVSRSMTRTLDQWLSTHHVCTYQQL